MPGTGTNVAMPNQPLPPWLLALMTGGAAISSGLTATQKQTASNTSSGSSSAMPGFAPEFTNLRDLLIQNAMKRMGENGLPAGTLEGGIRNINDTADAGRMSLDNMLTSRGISTSPIAGNVLANADVARQGQINTFKNIQLPALQNELEARNMGLAGDVLTQGRGMSATTTNGGTSTGTVGTNPYGYGLGSASQMLAMLYGLGAFNKG